MELQEAIKQRRSIRSFTDYIVTDEEILKVLESARWSPSWANTQVWEYIVIRDKTIIDLFPTNASTVIVSCAIKNSSGLLGGAKVTKYSEWFMFDLGAATQNLCLSAYELGLGTVILGYINHDLIKQKLSIPDNYEIITAIPIGKYVSNPAVTSRKEVKTYTHLNEFGRLYINE